MGEIALKEADLGREPKSLEEFERLTPEQARGWARLFSIRLRKALKEVREQEMRQHLLRLASDGDLTEERLASWLREHECIITSTNI